MVRIKPNSCMCNRKSELFKKIVRAKGKTFLFHRSCTNKPISHFVSLATEKFFSISFFFYLLNTNELCMHQHRPNCMWILRMLNLNLFFLFSSIKVIKIKNNLTDPCTTLVWRLFSFILQMFNWTFKTEFLNKTT